MKKFILIAILALAFTGLYAQNTAYAKIAGKGSLVKIERVSSGGYITAGYDSNYKAQIIRWDEQFNPVWKYKFTDPRYQAIQPHIVEANDGSFYYLTVSSEHTGSSMIIKFSSTGTMLWQKIYYVTTGNMNSFMLSKAAGSDNGFLFGGGQCTLTNYIIKCDENGNIVWQYQYYYPSSGVITCWSVIPDGNNYIVSSGYDINSLLTFKLDLTGNLVSHTAYTYTGMQIIPTRIVKLNSSGGYAIMGNYNSSNDNKTEFVAIYNSALSLLSFNELTVTYTQFTLYDIAAINNGKNVIAIGSIYNNSQFYSAMINLSSSGNIVWKKMSQGNSPLSNKNVEIRGITTKGYNTVSVGDGYNEGCIAAIIDSNGNGFCNDVQFNLTNYNRTLTLQSQTITPIASTALSSTVNYPVEASVTTSKYVYCGSLSLVEEKDIVLDAQINIYPNPAQNEIYIEIEGENFDRFAEFTIIDITGRIAFSRKYDNISKNSLLNIKIDNLPSGIYFLKFKGGKSETYSKFIISR
jgi:hypothetical protein